VVKDTKTTAARRIALDRETLTASIDAGSAPRRWRMRCRCELGPGACTTSVRVHDDRCCNTASVTSDTASGSDGVAQ
jgi:hypothetical protein